jgi:kynureninase
VVELRPRAGEATLRTEDILEAIGREGARLALVLMGGVNYLTGQAFDLPAITQAAHAVGAQAGFDLAHGAGNLAVRLHDWDVDFAVWCSYKYLNAGPGGLSGTFVHERHARDASLPRFAGWWGHDKQTRFKMGPEFQAIPGAEGWQLSNPPIFQLAALRASMELFDQAGMSAIRAKGDLLTGYLEYLLDQIPGRPLQVITPRDPAQRGCQLSLRIAKGDPRALLENLGQAGVICDFREPDIIRASPAPLYNRFADVWRFADVLARTLGAGA